MNDRDQYLDSINLNGHQSVHITKSFEGMGLAQAGFPELEIAYNERPPFN